MIYLEQTSLVIFEHLHFAFIKFFIKVNLNFLACMCVISYCSYVYTSTEITPQANQARYPSGYFAASPLFITCSPRKSITLSTALHISRHRIHLQNPVPSIYFIPTGHFLQHLFSLCPTSDIRSSSILSQMLSLFS